MRRALLFIILINSITCVTHNLAMEKEKDDDIELQADVAKDLEEQAQSDNENASESPDLENLQTKKGRSGLESQTPEKKVDTSQKKKAPKKKRCSRCPDKTYICCKVFTIGTLLLSFCMGPSVLTAVGISGMNENASSVTVFPASANITEKESCIYLPYTSDTPLPLRYEIECKKFDDERCHYTLEVCEGDVNSYEDFSGLASRGSQWSGWTGLLSMPTLYYIGKAIAEYAAQLRR